MSLMYSHQYWMEYALSLAETAAYLDEVPIGAIIVKNDRIISTGFNLKEKKNLVTSHAEINAIENACKSLNSWRLNDCTLYVTLEPCLMCSGAIYQSRIETVVYGTKDPKGGALGSLYEINQDERLNHRFEVIPNILQESCSQLLKDFFQKKRKQKKASPPAKLAVEEA